MEFVANKLLAPWRSLTSVYPHRSHSLVPSDFNGSLYQPGFWETVIDRNTYEPLVLSFGK